MAGQSAHRKPRSLIERAADHYDFASALRGGSGESKVDAGHADSGKGEAGHVEAGNVAPMPSAFELAATFAPDIVPVPAPVSPLPADYVPQIAGWSGIRHPIDREKLAQVGIIVPDSEATETSEEFRIVKRRVLSAAFDGTEGGPKDRGNFVLINSAHPNEGKTWCAINLAMSLAAEQDMDVLLVDGDFAKPGVCERLGLPEGIGFMDALVDPLVPIEQAILRTDIASLSVLPAGRHVKNDTEFVASERTRQLLDRLVAGHPRRIVILDSPPALAASAASELARHVGQTVLVVRADKTTEAALRDAVNLISACPNIRLLLNGVKFSSSGRQFGSYYGKAAS